MMRLGLGMAILLLASSALGQCRPEGRRTFAAGLEALARGDLTAAGSAFEELVQAQPDCAEARNNLAAVEVEQGRLAEAAQQLRQAVQLRPDYERAKANLHRVEALLAQRAGATASPVTQTGARPERLATEEGTAALSEKGTAGSAASSPTAPATRTPESTPTSPVATTAAAATSSPTARPTATPASTPTLVATAGKGDAAGAAGSPSPPPALRPEPAALAAGIAALEPQGTTACVIDTAQQRVCVYARTAETVAPGECYSITTSHVRAWPRWLMTAANERERLRLVDETGQRRLKLAPGRVPAPGDVLWLREEDFASLRAKVVPWRTSWVVMQKSGAPVAPDAGAAAAIQDALQGWRAAWEKKALDEYLGYYGGAFVPQAETGLRQWRERKGALFEQSGSVSVQVEGLSIFVVDATTAIATFEQLYRADAEAARDFKAIRWRREEGRWKIGAETVLRPVPQK